MMGINKKTTQCIISISFILFLSCGGGGGGSADVTPPGEIELIATKAGAGKITLSWTEPADADYDHVSISWIPGGTTGITISKGTTGYEITGLTTGTEYTITAKTMDISGNESTGESITITPPTTSVTVNTVSTAEDLKNLQADTSTYGDYYFLDTDLDLSGYATGEGWVPIGDSTNQFTGTFDGNGHVVRNLYINRPGSNRQGLFGYIGTSGMITDIVISDINISGNGEIGGLVGCNFGTITKSFISGDVNGSSYIGGLVGVNYGTIIISYTTGNVSGYNSVGGLVGYCDGGTITKSYSAAKVSYVALGNHMGGLVGENNGTIKDSYATGDVSGDMNYIGGLVGSNYDIIVNSYAIGNVIGGSNIGGLVGNNGGTVTDSFYDSITTGQSDTGKGTGKTTAQMKTLATFTDTDTAGLDYPWDFSGTPNDDTGNEDIWNIDGTETINNGYPYLTAIAPGS